MIILFIFIIFKIVSLTLRSAPVLPPFLQKSSITSQIVKPFLIPNPCSMIATLLNHFF